MIVPTRRAGPGLERLVASVAGSGETETIIVDNASGDPGLARLADADRGVELIALDRNLGFGRAVNHAARCAGGDALVVVNDDMVLGAGFVEAICERLDPASGVVMAAGVMCEPVGERIDTAGIEIDRALLIFDYLNGEAVSALAGAADPVGPCGGAAAFDREAFLAVGGFDERLFAYWEDADLALRLRLAGGRCRLAPGARGVHEHSATLGSGSARKNYLMGFGRGFVLRKWGGLSARRAVPIVARDLAICAGQAVVDRNLAGVRGRIAGFRAVTREHAYPRAAIAASTSPGMVSDLARRLRRRSRLRRR